MSARPGLASRMAVRPWGPPRPASDVRLQRSSVGCQPTVATPLVHEALAGPGQPLEASTRVFMESRFGHDFSGVRVHTDRRAAESARSIDALAYTVGSHVVFGAGQFTPDTLAGRRLLAHELTHVVQQAPDIRRQAGVIPVGPIDTSGPGFERARRYQPRLRPHVPQAPPIPPPPLIEEEHPLPATCPSAADVSRDLRASDVASKTEAEMQREVNLGRSLAAQAMPSSTRMIEQADRAIRAEFGRLLPAGRDFASRQSTTIRTPQEFSELRVPDEAAARRRIGDVALEVATARLHDLCINTPTHAALERHVAGPLLRSRGLSWVREFDRTRIGGQTRFPTVGGQVQPHVDLPSRSRNIGHIVVHEAMHFYVHPVYQRTAEASPLEDQLMEGGAEFLARHVINQRLGSNPLFRIHTGTYAAARGYVADYLMRGGLSSFSLAYFQGRVDLLGLRAPGARTPVQPRLRVGASDDPVEREADRMADWVTRGDSAGVHAGAVEEGRAR